MTIELLDSLQKKRNLLYQMHSFENWRVWFPCGCGFTRYFVILNIHTNLGI